MSAAVTFTPLLGCEDGSPLCSLLTVDDCHILLDCGWDSKFDPSLLEPLQAVVPKLDAILISHPEVSHLGALPYVVGRMGLPASCQVYATIPVCKLGQVVMYDAYQSCQLRWEYQLREELVRRGLDPYSDKVRDQQTDLPIFEVFDLDDVDLAFADTTDSITVLLQAEQRKDPAQQRNLRVSMQSLRYSQQVPLFGKGAGVTISPLEAGHSVGGTIWRIQKEAEDVVYATNLNHKTERHLNAAKLELIKQPTHFITDTFEPVEATSTKREEREKGICTQVVETLRSGGNVLMPTDTACRSLALMIMLETYWRENPGLQRPYSVVFLCEPGGTVLEKIGGLMEYLSDSCKRASGQRGTPNLLDFKHVQRCLSLEQLHSYFKPPMVVLATHADMDAGMARQLFSSWAEDPRNTVIFTTRASSGSLQQQLLSRSDESSTAVTVDFVSQQKLQGAELEAYELSRDEQVAADTAAAAEAMQMEVDDQGQVELDAMAVEQLPNALERESSHVGARWSWEQPRSGYRSFSYVEPKPKWTEYGVEPDNDMFAEADKIFGTQPVRAVMEVTNEDEQEDEEVETPFALRVEQKVLNVQAKVLYLDLEGRTDTRDLKKIIINHEPRQLVLMRGSHDASQKLSRDCLRARPKMKISIARESMKLELTSDLNMFKMLVHNSLFSSTRWQQCGDYEVGYLSGILEQLSEDSGARHGAPWQLIPDPQGGTLPRLEQPESAQELSCNSEDSISIADMDQDPNLARPLFHVGKLQLSELKLILEKACIRAEFRPGGKLAVGDDGALILHQSKKTKGEITMDGVPSPLFYQVRDIIYEQYCIV